MQRKKKNKKIDINKTNVQSSLKTINNVFQ